LRSMSVMEPEILSVLHSMVKAQLFCLSLVAQRDIKMSQAEQSIVSGIYAFAKHNNEWNDTGNSKIESIKLLLLPMNVLASVKNYKISSSSYDPALTPDKLR
jgi:hypothetical protein